MKKLSIVIWLWTVVACVCVAQQARWLFAAPSYQERMESARNLNRAQHYMEAYEVLKVLRADADSVITAHGLNPATLPNREDFKFHQDVLTSLAECAYKMNFRRVVKAVAAEQLEAINGRISAEIDDIKYFSRQAAAYYKVIGDAYYLWGAENVYYFSRAQEYYEKALDFYTRSAYDKEVSDEDERRIVRFDLAQVHYAQGNYEIALEYIKQANANIRLTSSTTGRLSQSNANLQSFQQQLSAARAMCRACMGDYDKALFEIDNVINEAKENRSKSLPEWYRRKAKIQMMRHFDEGTDIEDADKLYAFYFKAIKDSVENDFMQMTSDQREQYWMIKRPFVVDCYQLENKAPELLYDVTLYNKGILLQTCRSFDLLLKDAELAQLNRRRLYDAQLIALGDDSDTAGEYESTLIKRMRTDGRRTKFFASLRYTWKDVQKVLPKRGCAIEFVEYEKKGNMYFGALVLKKGGNPQFIELCNADVLGSYYPDGARSNMYSLMKSTNGSDKDYIYSDSLIGRTIWSDDLVAAIADCQKVYFSPDGYLHQLAIEFMIPVAMKDKKLYRLSSTRVLVEGRAPNAKRIKEGAALLLGGISYSADYNNYHNQKSGNDAKAFEIMQEKSVYFTDLPGAKEECDSIIYYRHNNKDLLLDSQKATEQAFYEKCNQYPLLHISTHGYFGGDRSVYNELLASASTDVLSESVLLLANCRTNLNDIFFDSSKPDGLLSAREVACLDLSNVELVTTSACQTGLGIITADGIYGMERGFKSAGAKGLLLTLWSVDVTSARMFFTSFYSNIAQGLSVHEAYAKARQQLAKPQEASVKRRSLNPKKLTREERTVVCSVDYSAPQHINPYILVDVWE